jgi:hypothetical protein
MIVTKNEKLGSLILPKKHSLWVKQKQWRSFCIVLVTERTLLLNTKQKEWGAEDLKIYSKCPQ